MMNPASKLTLTDGRHAFYLAVPPWFDLEGGLALEQAEDGVRLLKALNRKMGLCTCGRDTCGPFRELIIVNDPDLAADAAVEDDECVDYWWGVTG
jgi:hypothetical protein